MEKKPKADIIVGFCFIFAAVAFLIPSFQLGISGPEAIPGPGAVFFPAVCAIFTIFFGAWIILSAVKSGSVDFFGKDPEQLANIKIITFIVAIFILFVLLWYFIDFFLATVLLCLGFNKAFGRSWKFNIIFSAVYVALIYGIFVQLLDITFTI